MQEGDAGTKSLYIPLIRPLSRQALVIRQVCDAIAWRLRGRRGRQTTRKPTPGKLRKLWADAWTEQAKDLLRAEQPEQRQQRPRAGPAPNLAVLAHWKDRWKAREPREPRLDRSRGTYAGPAKARLQLHAQLQKAESAVLIQARTGCIGLAQFLQHRKVPGVVTATCECGYGPETTKHIVVHYALVDEESRRQLRTGGFLDYNWLLNTPEGAQKLSKWLIRLGRLQQFSLASKLLYGE